MANDNEVKDMLKDLLKERSKVLKLAQEKSPDLQAFLNEHFIDNDFKSRMSRLGNKIRYPIISRLYKSRFQESLQQATRDVFEKYIPHVTNKLTGDDNDEYYSILCAYEAVIRNCKPKTDFWKKSFIIYIISFFVYTLFTPMRGKIIELCNLFFITLHDSRGDAWREFLMSNSLQTTLMSLGLILPFLLMPFALIYFAVEGYMDRSAEITISLHENHSIFSLFFNPESKSFDRDLLEGYPSKLQTIESALDREFGIKRKKQIDLLLTRDILGFLYSLMLCAFPFIFLLFSLIFSIIFPTHQIFTPTYQLLMAACILYTLWILITAIRDLSYAFYRWKLRNKQYESRKQLQHN
jgi:hypothetical protein